MKFAFLIFLDLNLCDQIDLNLCDNKIKFGVLQSLSFGGVLFALGRHAKLLALVPVPL